MFVQARTVKKRLTLSYISYHKNKLHSCIHYLNPFVNKIFPIKSIPDVSAILNVGYIHKYVFNFIFCVIKKLVKNIIKMKKMYGMIYEMSCGVKYIHKQITITSHQMMFISQFHIAAIYSS